MPNLKLSEDRRREIGDLIWGYVQAGLDTQGRAPLWWRDVERFHRNEGTGSGGMMQSGPDDSGLPEFHIPLSQPLQDGLSAQVCTVVGKQEPYMLDTGDDKDVADAKQEALHRVWHDADFELRIRTACSICTDTDLVYYRVCPLGDDQVEISVHHPSTVFVFPALPTGAVDATAMGHQVWKPRRQITEGQRRAGGKEARYYGEKILVEGSPDDDDKTGSKIRAGVENVPGPDPDQDALIELWDVLVRLDVGKGEKWHRATIAYGDVELLALEEYIFTEPWYFESRLIGSKDYYPATSVGRNLFPLQDCYNALWSMFYTAGMTGAMPPVIGPKLLEKYTKYGYGDYIETDSTVQPWSPNVRPMIQPIPLMIANLERVGERVARVSQNTLGQASPDQTATEASIKAAGVAVGLEEYIANFSFPFRRMAAHTLEIVGTYYKGFAKRFALQDPNAPEEGDLSSLPMPEDVLALPMGGETEGFDGGLGGLLA